jgi:hypothetical protein
MKHTLILVLSAAAVLAQDVGMGIRRGSGARFEVSYTNEIVTPHEKWANPLPGGPIRLLAVPSVSEGRTIIELAQRLQLDLTTVTIDSAWDRNKWTMAFGRDYGARADRGNLSLIYSYLEAELTSDKHFDAILLPLNHGWESLTPASRQAIERRIRQGAGLILLRPSGPLAPLIAEAAGADTVPATPWTRDPRHHITRAIPVEAFPFPNLSQYRYTAAPGAQVLISPNILAVRDLDKGRIAAFGFHNQGLSWAMPLSARHEVSNLQWEYYYALLARTVIWAARREPAGEPSFDTWRLKSFDGKLLKAGGGEPDVSVLSGAHFLERQGPADFHIRYLPAAQPETIENLRVSPAIIAEGARVQVQWSAARPATAELIDGFGRIIARAPGSNSATMIAARPLTHSGLLRVTAGTGSAQTPVRFAASSRKWEDYEIIMPWYGPGGYQPWLPALDEQFRRVGITALSSPDRNFKLVASAGLHDTFGVYYYRNQNYAKRKEAYVETKDKRHITRDVILQAPEFHTELREQLQKRIGPLSPLHPLAYYIADESSLTSYTDAFDVDWSPQAIAGFRQWVQREYGSLNELNKTWGTAFSAWDAVLPMTTEEAQKHGNFAPWSDHRVYMQREFLAALRLARDIVREIDPGSVSSISGTQVPTAHNGADWYEIDQFMDYLQPYSGGNQDAMHHLFRPGILLTGFTGYGLTGSAAQYQQWQRLFYGHTGASIFWHYTILNPDLTLSEQGKALAEAFGPIQSGIGRVFLNSEVAEDGVAIHFSMNSIRGQWIADGQILPTVGNVNRTSKNYARLVERRDAWVKALERKGVQFRFLATPQIESGALADFKVLILPESIALSDAEVRQIRGFAARGGVVYLDGEAGLMDERCRWRKPAAFHDVSSGFVRSGPERFAFSHPLGIEGDALTTVRKFGSSKLIGVLPKEPVRVEPQPGPVRYDLMRGGLVQTAVEARPDRPAIFLERFTHIRKLDLSPSLQLRLTDEHGAPVDRSVVHLDVFDPGGKLVRHYSGNVTIVDGKADYQIPFAMDETGSWTVKARDAISGLTAQRTMKR